MLIQTLAFYFFAVMAILTGLFVVRSRNPVYGVLWLILAFLSSAGLFVLQGAEFVAMLMVIVYVGAVAVLFLFVVMMLDVDFTTFRAGMARYIPIGLLIGGVLLMMLGIEIGDWKFADSADELRQSPTPLQEITHNTLALGQVIYTDYVLLFQLAGLILLVAMVGAIVLTHRRRTGVKRQDSVEQIYRDPSKSIELKDIRLPSGNKK